PMARSYVPAYGLMQIVPQSGGKDASEFVFGRPLILSPSFLYNAQNNINMGTAYLHLLSNKYLRKIEDPESRLYCAIAAYNTGPGNVARAFVGKKNIEKAVAAINKMTAEEVYDHMTENLPYEETRHYLRRVSQRIKAYRTMADKG
ncbi:MAG: transglycosylase SLT domain-containing protein, partial [Thermodesulfobacteriota bacterium]|nr:transglycosylase SLT domain-containing protein [Thermodesulfobacteriota bacterium]